MRETESYIALPDDCCGEDCCATEERESPEELTRLAGLVPAWTEEDRIRLEERVRRAESL